MTDSDAGFRVLVKELLNELDGSYGHTADALIAEIRERLKRNPFWPKCGICGKPIATEAEADEMWVGPINAPGGQKGYVHKGGGACLTAK